MPDRADLAIYQGDDWGAIVTVRNADGTEADITGYTAQAQIRSNVADDAPIIVVEIEATVASPEVNLVIPHTDTADIHGKYVWDLQVVSPTGEVTTVLAGKVMVTQEVTRE